MRVKAGMGELRQKEEKDLRIVTTVVLAAAVLAGVTTSIASSASAAPVTARADAAALSTVRAASPLDDDLGGVSCQTARNCLAVGFGNRIDPLAETWNGTAWHADPAKLPAGSGDGALRGVTSAGTSGTFVAVGSFTPKDPPYYSRALSDSWNGKAWAPVQATTAAITGLGAVSCVSPESCLAVGGENSPEGGYNAGIAYSWNGATWTALNPPVPPASLGSLLSGVSCVAGPFCVAVGVGYSTKNTTLIYSWNGSTWKTLTPATPKGVSVLSLDGVSCASAKSCVAVGNGVGKPGGVAEVWNGTAWRATGPIAWTKGATSPSVTGVSCVTASYCVAVGYIDGNPKAGDASTGRAAASLWNGRTWTATAVAAPGKDKASLFNSVTCLRRTFCVAVGQAGPSGSTNGTGLSGFWNGKTWHLVAAK